MAVTWPCATPWKNACPRHLVEPISSTSYRAPLHTGQVFYRSPAHQSKWLLGQQLHIARSHRPSNEDSPGVNLGNQNPSRVGPSDFSASQQLQFLEQSTAYSPSGQYDNESVNARSHQHRQQYIDIRSSPVPSPKQQSFTAGIPPSISPHSSSEHIASIHPNAPYQGNIRGFETGGAASDLVVAVSVPGQDGKHASTNGSPPSNQPAIPAAGSESAEAEAKRRTSVAEALARAQQALDKVESSLDDIERLPSAQPENRMVTLLKAALKLAGMGATCAALVASHAAGLAFQWAAAIVGACGIAAWGYHRASLSASGALAAIFVGASTLGCSLRFGATLVAFFFSSSKLTQYKEEMKEGLDESSRKGGQRDWIQVLCNGLVPSLLAIAYGVLAGCVDVPLGISPQLELWRARLITLIMGGFLGYYACCCGDTWASELGPLSSDTPRLITTFRPVRKGTNGGVTLLGTSASIFGGMFIGLIFYLAATVSPTLWVIHEQQAVAMAQWRLVPLGLMAGLLGSLLDSLLGATLQFTGYNTATNRITSTPGPNVMHISGKPWLTNNLVNLISATVTSLLTALATVFVFGV